MLDDETTGTADEDIANFMSCFAILSSPSRNNRIEYHPNDSSSSNNPTALSRLTPGAYSNLPTTHKTNTIEDSLSLDISQLRQQYKKLKERNKQVQIIIQTASNEQKQRSRTPSIHSSTTTNTENFRRPTISSSLEFPAPKLPSSVCSISGGPLVNHLLIKPTDIKRNQFKKTVSMKSSSSTSSSPPPVSIHDRQSKIIQSTITESIPREKSQRSKEEEAEEAAELQQEINQLLTSLNLEKPTSTSEQLVSTEETVQLENVARTVYNYEKPQATKTEKKETPNLIDRILTSNSVQIPKYSSFNPFPSRSFNENVAVNGYKLGLYAPDPTNR